MNDTHTDPSLTPYTPEEASSIHRQRFLQGASELSGTTERAKWAVNDLIARAAGLEGLEGIDPEEVLRMQHMLYELGTLITQVRAQMCSVARSTQRLVDPNYALAVAKAAAAGIEVAP